MRHTLIYACLGLAAGCGLFSTTQSPPSRSLGELYRDFLKSVVPPPLMFEELNGLDIFNAVRTNALAETGKQDARAFSVVIRVFDKDVDTALRQTYTFSLESLSIYDSFMHAGALMNIPVTFTNDHFSIGAGYPGTEDNIIFLPHSEQYSAFLGSVLLPGVTFRNKNCNDIFNSIRLKALSEIEKRNECGFSVVIDQLDSVVAEHRTYTFSLESLSIYDSFMHAGALMNIPVTFTNGCFFIGNKADDDTSVRRVTDDSADPFK